MHEKIIIIDFGSQVTQLIARRAREEGVYSLIVKPSITIEEIKAISPKAIILSGSPASVSEKDAPKIGKEIFDLGLPIFGICYGEQITCSLLGGAVESSDKREFGRAEMDIDSSSDLFKNINVNKINVWMSHGDKVTKLPEGFKVIGRTSNAPFAAIENKDKKIYGVQFHPEVTHSEYGEQIIRNFLKEVVGFKGDWSVSDFTKEKITEIQETVGQDKVICAVSGGVDSAVLAVLLYKAIGEQVYPIFVNTGLMRKNEAEAVKEIFKKLNVPLNVIEAEEIFLRELAGIYDPEKKRKIIGKLFIDIFDKEAAKVANAKFLAQGTLYSDVIESSSSGLASTIKSHHNVGGLPKDIKFSLIEPFREIFKDEVRKIGRDLGLPESIIGRHPFPGPGLAIRIISDITKEKIRILQEADNIYVNMLKEHGLYDKIWQAFVVLLPIQTVGVMGDARTYEYVCALRAVNSFDGMTADFYPFDMEFLAKVSNKIVNEVKGINRVTYDVTSKPPATIEWE